MCAAGSFGVKFSATKVFATAVQYANTSRRPKPFRPIRRNVITDVQENLEIDDNEAAGGPSRDDFIITPLQTLKWSCQCKAPLKPVVTKEIDF